MTNGYHLKQIKSIAAKLDEKMDIATFKRIPGVYLDLDKYDLLNVLVDQTKKEWRITEDHPDIQLYNQDINLFPIMKKMSKWINSILELYPMNINGEITFLLTDDMIEKTFLFKVNNIKQLVELLNMLPSYFTGVDTGIQIINNDQTGTSRNYITKFKIYPMEYFMFLYNRYNFLSSDSNLPSFTYANYDIIMSRIQGHKYDMNFVVDQLRKNYSYVGNSVRELQEAEKYFDYNFYRYHDSFYFDFTYKKYDYKKYDTFKRYMVPSTITKLDHYRKNPPTYDEKCEKNRNYDKDYLKWLGKESILTQLEKKPNNLSQIWNTRFLEQIDF